MTWFLRLWLLGFCGIPLIFVGVGSYQAWGQWHRLRSFVPTEAVVTATDIKTHISNDSDTGTSYSYQPLVSRRYQVQGRAYTTSEVLPLAGYAGGGDWARQTINRYHPGERVTTYYDPANPSRGFLLPQLSYAPLIFIQFPMLFLLIGALVAAFFLAPGQPGARAPQPQSGGTFRLRTRRSIALRRNFAALGAAAWWMAGLLTSGGYFLCAPRPYETLAIVCTAIYAGIGLIPLGFALYYTLVKMELDEPRVSTDHDKFVSGGQVTVLLEQRARSALTIDEAQLALICTAVSRTTSAGETNYTMAKYYEKRCTVFRGHRLMPGEPISAMQAFTIPADPPTSAPGSKTYPRYDWAIEVHVQVRGRPGYRGKFPITVEPAAEPAVAPAPTAEA
jgi:hypothetical protein